MSDFWHTPVLAVASYRGGVIDYINSKYNNNVYHENNYKKFQKALSSSICEAAFRDVSDVWRQSIIFVSSNINVVKTEKSQNLNCFI